MAAEALIAGGGVAGLVLARDLLRGGMPVHVFEAADRLGGQVAGHEVDGVRLDAAAESFATRDSTVRDLVAELGLDDRVVTPRPEPAWLVRDDGSAQPLPATGLLGVPSVPDAPDVRAAIGDDGVARALLDRSLGARVGADATSFGALVRARMGDAVVDRLVTPITRGVHSKEPDALAVEAAHPRLRALLAEHGSLAEAVVQVRAAAPAGSAVASLRGGMHTLVDALAADVVARGGRISTGSRATALAPGSLDVGGARHDGFVVRAHPAARASARTIRLVTLVVRSADLDAAPRGTGVLVAADAPGISARAITHVTAKWAWAAEAFPGRHVLRLSYDADVVDPAAHALDDAERILGLPLELLLEPVTAQWRRSAVSDPADDVPTVGETVAGTGLAAVVAHARRTASAILEQNRINVGGTPA